MRNSKKKPIRFVLTFLTVLAFFLCIGYAIMWRVDSRKRESAGYIAENTIGRMQNVYSNYMLSYVELLEVLMNYLFRCLST